MDMLSDVLRAVRLTGAVYFTIDGSAPWVAETSPGAVIAPHPTGSCPRPASPLAARAFVKARRQRCR
jgi:hypothetical protein